MKRRLRKKRRLGEFREDCFCLGFRIDPSVTQQGIDDLVDEFLEMLVDRNLQCGGGGDHEWSCIVQGDYRRTVTEQDRDAVLEWTAQHEKILESSAGPLRDAWHGWD